MSGFKTKKLAPTSTKDVKKIAPITEIQEKKKNVVLQWVIGISIVISSIAFFVTFGLNLTRGNEKNTDDKFAPIVEIAGEILSEKKAGTTNVLIAGIGGRGHEGSDLTDSIMLASLNNDEKRVTLLSIPRDLYVAYPKNKGAGRINSLYGLGKADGVGIKYLADKVAEITGQQIDHYAVIDFSGFKEVIDIMGGVDVNVPEDLIDREYPDDNWGYETLVVRKGLQTMDGELALKYARSRHSTSDFDRSNRQQLIIKAIKEKLLGSETITSPGKITEVFSAVMDHIDTDMSLAKIGEIVFENRKIESENIKIFTLNNECGSIKQCAIGAYLYNPSRDLFGGASVIIPENARANKLSYYDDIRRFVDVTFHFPHLSETREGVVIVTSKANIQKAKNIGLSLKKMGFHLNESNPIVTTTGSIAQSHVNIYWHKDLAIGINPETSPTIQALQYLEESLTYVTVQHNEYVTQDGPKIEIVLGDDIDTYFPFAKSIYYIPAPPQNTGSTVGTGDTIVSGESRRSTINPTTPIKTQQNNTQAPTTASPNQSSSHGVQPGEWEDFGN